MTTERDELERLRRENAALNEQVKLLVRTEQRLYRSQNARDRQLDRLRALARLNLSCSNPTTGEASILMHAAELVAESFHVDGVWTLRPTPDGCRRLTPDGAADLPVEACGAFERWAVEHSTIRVGERVLPDELRRALELPEPARTAWLPLVDADGGPLGWILAWRSAASPRSYHRVDLHEGHLPYLELLRRQVESALRNSALTAELQRNGRHLATSNARLSESLAKLERTQQELLQARKLEAIGRLAGGVAHDFNNLLTVILNHADSLRQAAPVHSEAQESAERILEASQSAADITRQLLAFSRKELRRPVALDLNVLAAETARMLERLLGERIRLELDLASEPGIVRADPAQIEQVLLNLVVNARDAMPSGGTLRVRTRPAGDEPGAPEDAVSFFALSVSDTGEGIDEATRARIFEPFFTTKRRGHGTGLGLAMVYGAVRQNDGHVTVSSRPGVGTTFTVFLPRERGPVSGPDASPEVEPVRDDARVLVVEDEEQVRAVIARILQRQGYAVHEAASAEDALEHLGEHAPVDVVVTDVILPGESGGRLVERLRDRRPDLPAVFLSGYSFDELDTALLTPHDEFLQKPFTPAALCSRVRQALASVGARPPVCLPLPFRRESQA